jgi:hypothetical protein
VNSRDDSEPVAEDAPAEEAEDESDEEAISTPEFGPPAPLGPPGPSFYGMGHYPPPAPAPPAPAPYGPGYHPPQQPGSAPPGPALYGPDYRPPPQSAPPGPGFMGMSGGGLSGPRDDVREPFFRSLWRRMFRRNT